MKKLMILLAFMSLSTFGFAKGAGYSNTEWGMNPSQVVAVENGRAQPIKPKEYSKGWGKVEINTVKVGGSEYLVTFIFDDADSLIQTNMVSIEKKNVGIINLQYDSLNKLLTQKYGKPQFQNLNTATWKTATTTIELKKTIIQSISFAQVGVSYMPNSKIKDETSNL